MTSQVFVLLSGALSFGVPLALAIRELLILPTLGRGGDEPPPDDVPIPGPKPLPDCLRPATLLARAPVRIRPLEVA